MLSTKFGIIRKSSSWKSNDFYLFLSILLIFYKKKKIQDFFRKNKQIDILHLLIFNILISILRG